MQVRNQTYLRRRNKEDIINLLREQSRSYSDIARVLKLSNTAIAKIADDLIADDIICRDGDTKGRAGINLSINQDYGYVIAIDFSRWQIDCCAADFSGKVLVKHRIDNINFLPEDLNKLIEEVYALKSEEVLKGRTLRCIALASPGKIDKESGKFILNPRFKSWRNISLKEVFSEEFGCLVTIKNDINLALSGEKMYGVLKDVNNALMLHVDVGAGAAILINGKVYEGSRGFAGEVGYFKLNMLLSDEDNYGNLNYANYYDSTSLFSSLSIVKREVFSGCDSIIQTWLRERKMGWDEITIEMMIDAYRLGDVLVRKVLDSAARVIGTFAGCVSEMLDVDTIVLNGSVIRLGEPYLKQVEKYAGGYPVLYSGLAENATIMGAIDAGIRATYDERM